MECRTNWYFVMTWNWHRSHAIEVFFPFSISICSASIKCNSFLDHSTLFGSEPNLISFIPNCWYDRKFLKMRKERRSLLFNNDLGIIPNISLISNDVFDLLSLAIKKTFITCNWLNTLLLQHYFALNICTRRELFMLINLKNFVILLWMPIIIAKILFVFAVVIVERRRLKRAFALSAACNI